MIRLQEGSKDCLPYVQVEIEPGLWPFQWWFEVTYYDRESWVNDWEKGGGGFGLWFVWRKAREALIDCWDEQYEATPLSKQLLTPLDGR